jgi:hypothetical protein
MAGETLHHIARYEPGCELKHYGCNHGIKPVATSETKEMVASMQFMIKQEVEFICRTVGNRVAKMKKQ